MLGLGSGMGVAFKRISETISGGSGNRLGYFECLSLGLYPQNGNMKMVFLFLPSWQSWLLEVVWGGLES